MTSIKYTYRVVAVGDRTMDVEFEAEGFAPVIIGVPKPREGESIDPIIQSYSPVAFWIDQITPRAEVVAGVSGVVEVQTAPPAGPPTLADLLPVSHAQMIAALILSEIITREEGVEWIKGQLPSAVEMMIASLPEEHQVIAELRAIRPTAVVPTDPLVAALAAAQGKDEDDLIDLFTLAAQL